MSDHVRIAPAEKEQCMWGKRTNWPFYHGNILLYKLYIILKMVTKSIWNNAPNHPKTACWSIEKLPPAYNMQQKKNNLWAPGPMCLTALQIASNDIAATCRTQLDSCLTGNRKLLIWGFIVDMFRYKLKVWWTPGSTPVCCCQVFSFAILWCFHHQNL